MNIAKNIFLQEIFDNFQILCWNFQVKGALKKTHRDYFKSYQVIFDNDHHFDSDMMSQQSYDSYVK